MKDKPPSEKVAEKLKYARMTDLLAISVTTTALLEAYVNALGRLEDGKTS